jgi:protein-disulfide isomerase
MRASSGRVVVQLSALIAGCLAAAGMGLLTLTQHTSLPQGGRPFGPVLAPAFGSVLLSLALAGSLVGSQWLSRLGLLLSSGWFALAFVRQMAIQPLPNVLPIVLLLVLSLVMVVALREDPARRPSGRGIAIGVVALTLGCASLFAREARTLVILGSSGPPRTDDASAESRTLYLNWYAHQRSLRPQPQSGVLVEEYSDYTCPGCRASYAPLERTLSTYSAKHPGAVRFVRHAFPLDSKCNPSMIVDGKDASNSNHKFACDAAATVILADRHGRSKEMSAWLFTNEDYTSEGLWRAAAEFGGVTPEDRATMRDVMGILRTEATRASSLGIKGTPTFRINGIRVPGPAAPEFAWTLDYEIAQMPSAARAGL